MQSTELKGLIVPLLVPFGPDGRIDRDALGLHLDFLSGHGVRRIMVNGTTGEFHSLLPEERRMVLDWSRGFFDGTIVLHLGGLGLAQNLEELRAAADLGADAIAALPPIYPAGLDAGGIIDYFNALAAETSLPFILYNFPRHCGNAITPEILRAVPHFAIKDSAQNLELIEHTPRYFVGSSSSIFGPVQQGAAGFVCATANVRPELYAALETMLASARTEEADILQQEVRSYTAPFSAGGVPALKQALARKLKDYPARVRCPLGRSAGRGGPPIPA